MEDINKAIELSKLISETAILLKHNMMKGYGNLGITVPQGMVLGIISKQGQVKISELSEKLSLSNSTISGIVDRLEKQRFVTRARSEKDRRVVYVQLSQGFAEMHKDFHARAEKNLEDLMAKATAEELDKITVGLHTLKQLIEREGNKH